MARPRANVATNAGSRRSEKRTPHPHAGMSPAQVMRKTEEDPLHPGMKTVIVPRLNPRDPKAASPIGMYKGLGYKIVSEDPLITGGEDEVKMGIDLNIWLKREEERMQQDKDAFTSLIEETDENLGSINNIQNGGLRFFGDQSGLHVGQPMTVTSVPDDED